VRKLTLALVLATAPPVAVSSASADLLDHLVIGAAAADLVSTELALSRPGTKEINPFGPSPPARVGLKVAGTVAVLAVSRKMNRKASRVLKVVAIVVWSGAAVHNLRVRR
jgi:hypothetical protein